MDALLLEPTQLGSSRKQDKYVVQCMTPGEPGRMKTKHVYRVEVKAKAPDPRTEDDNLGLPESSYDCC